MRKGFYWFLILLSLAACQPNHPASPEPSPRKSILPIRDRSLYPVIVAFGNSLTAGSGVTMEQAYPAQLQALLDQAGYSYRVVNAGIGGNTTSDGLARLQSVIDQNPRLVILELGANDGLRGLPIPTVRKNLQNLIERLRSSDLQVVLAGMRIPPNYGPEYSEQFHQVYIDLANRYHLTLIPFFLENVAGRPELNLDDGIHPTAQGHHILAKTVFETIKPLL